jgi:hypothetical protein
MHEMSLWDVLRNNPEWVAAIAAVVTALAALVFGVVTALIIASQVAVMIWQTRSGDRRERHQNNLARLQHEHDWLDALNAKRQSILRTAEKLHIKLLYIIADHGPYVDVVWNEFLELRTDLNLKMKILDVAAYADAPDSWYNGLTAWCDDLFTIVKQHFKRATKHGVPDVPMVPDSETINALKATETKHDPVKRMFALRLAIKTETEAFKHKWDAEIALNG